MNNAEKSETLNKGVISQRPQGESPRFACYPEHFLSIRSALDRVGHVVIEDVLDKTTLDQVYRYAKGIFKDKDDRYQRGKMTDSEVYTHHGSTYVFNHSDIKTQKR